MVFPLICIVLVVFCVWISDQNAKNMRLNTKKATAMQPSVAKQLLRKSPKNGDIVLGKYKTKYVCSSISDDAHYLIVGGSGSGKSSCIVLPTLLCGAQNAVFAVDIKGELSEKSGYVKRPNTCIFNPQRRETYGYDPFFLLSEESTDQQIFETMQAVSFSLIPLSAEIKDPFWKQSAKKHYTNSNHFLPQEPYKSEKQLSKLTFHGQRKRLFSKDL